MLISRADNSLIARWWLSVDKTILALATFLTVIGLFMMFEASPYAAERLRQSGFFYLSRYPVYLALSIIAMLVISTQKARTLELLAPLAFAAIFALTVMTLFSRPINGAHRWVFIGGFQLQPSEFLKPITALLLGMLLAKFKRSDDPTRRKVIGWSIAALFAMICGVLLRQPDLGMTLTFALAIFGVGIFLAGARWKWISLCVAIIFASSFIAYKAMPHVNNRVERFFSADKKDRHQVEASLKTIRSAGLFSGGKGNLRQHVPDVHTDFVFAAMVDSVGILPSIFVIAMSLFLSLNIFAKAARLPPAAFYACSMIASYLALQSCVNISSALGLIPPKGMTLPFVSSGGSSLISSYMAIGIVLCLLRPQKKEEQKK